MAIHVPCERDEGEGRHAEGAEDGESVLAEEECRRTDTDGHIIRFVLWYEKWVKL